MPQPHRSRVDAVFRSIDASVDIGNNDLADMAFAIAEQGVLTAQLRARMLDKGYGVEIIDRVERIGVRALRANDERLLVLRHVRKVGIQCVADELALNEPVLTLLREAHAMHRSNVLAKLLDEVG